MKTFAIVLILTALAVPAVAGIIWDEGSQGDLSSDAAAPTAIVFPGGSSTITGTINGNPGIDRDFITFTIPSGWFLYHLNLVALDPEDIAFASLNAGSTSWIPSPSTAANFLAGIHIGDTEIGQDLMPLFVTQSQTGNSLPVPALGPGTYCFLIQQTGIFQSYTVEFFMALGLPVDASTWGKVKALYR